VRPDCAVARALALFAPGRDAGFAPGERAFLDRFAAQILDRAIQDGTFGLNLFEAMNLLAHAGWPIQTLMRQAMADPDLPAALSRVWGRAARHETLLPGHWPAGTAAALCKSLVTSRMVERVMNYAMAENVAPEETDAAMRTADILIRSA
jgi:hypothetical protein